MKLKLDPSSRLKRRYLLIEGSKSDIEKAMREYLGILGMVKAAPLFLESQGTRQILVVNREMLTDVKASFALCNSHIRPLRVSGTIRSLLHKT